MNLLNVLKNLVKLNLELNSGLYKKISKKGANCALYAEGL
jgi:hypothetical protein